MQTVHFKGDKISKGTFNLVTSSKSKNKTLSNFHNTMAEKLIHIRPSSHMTQWFR